MSAGGPDARPGEAVASAGVGPALRSARERRGLSIAAVSEALHVDSKVIEAMEAGRFTVFDAPVYARGFIRKYGAYLELPVNDLIAGYDSLSGGPAAPTLIPPTTATAPMRDLSKLTTPLLFVLALAVVGASLWWWLARPHGGAVSTATTTTTIVPAVQPATATVAPAREAADAGPRTEVAPLVEHVALPERARAPAESRPAAASAVLVLKGLRECWVEVYSSSGAKLFSDLVKAGDTHSLPGPGPWRVFLGNADGVRLSIDERTIEVPVAYRAGATARFVVAGNGIVK